MGLLRWEFEVITTMLQFTYKLCTPVHLVVRGISHGTILPLTLKTSLNTKLVNIFNSTLHVGSLLFVTN